MVKDSGVKVIEEERRDDYQRQITEDDLEALTDLVSDRLQERAQLRYERGKRIVEWWIKWAIRLVGGAGVALSLWHHETIKVSLFG